MSDFEKWWNDHGQYVRGGGGDYEKSFSYAAWVFLVGQSSSEQRVKDAAIIRQTTITNLHQIITERDALIAKLEDQLKAQAVEPCGNCFEGKSDMDHVCPKCNGTGTTPSTPAAEPDNEKLRMALENCRLLAARHRKEDWALLILGFCAEGGVVGSAMR